MSALEDAARPSHGDRDCWTESEADEEESDVASPWVGVSDQSRHEDAGDLETHRDGEEQCAVAVEAVGDGRDEENGDEVADPDRCNEEREGYAAE